MYSLARRIADNLYRSVPLLALTLALAGLAACGGGGGGGGNNSNSPAAVASNLFAGDTVNLAIGSLINKNPSAGQIAVDRIVTGSDTKLSSYLSDFALDAAHDRLYVANGRSILVFNNISTAQGNVPPARVVTSIPSGTNGSFQGLYLDTVHDVLYVGHLYVFGSAEIQVFNNASTANNATPNRTFVFTSDYITSISVDVARDIFYVYSSDPTNNTQVNIFDNASTVSGVVSPDRAIVFGDSYSSGAPLGLVVDSSNNRLYVSAFSSVYVFDSASTKNGDRSAAERVIDLQGPPATSNLALDVGANRLYTVDGSGLNIIANASTANGAVTYNRLLAPNGGQLSAVAVKQ